MGKTIAALETFIIHKRPRQLIWITVKRWTFRSGTCLRYIKSGWCFAGIQNSFILSNNWKINRLNWFLTTAKVGQVDIQHAPKYDASGSHLSWHLSIRKGNCHAYSLKCYFRFHNSPHFWNMGTGYNLEEFKNIKANATCCYLGECGRERPNYPPPPPHYQMTTSSFICPLTPALPGLTLSFLLE